MLPYPLVLNFLYRELLECQEMSVGSLEECFVAFAMRMEEPSTKKFLEDAQATIRADPKSFPEEDLVQDAWIKEFQNQIDYVPGLSKGKRQLDVESTDQFLDLGRQMKTAGNNCFAGRDFEMALTRYKRA